MDKNSKSLKTQVGGNHYKDMAIQPIEFTMKNGLGFLEGNIIKYVSRHTNKNGRQDLEKAKHYIELALDHYYPEKLKVVKKTTKTSKKLPARSFIQKLTPSPSLSKVIGSEPVTRTEAMTKVWKYIKKHDLQDKKNKRIINADENLKPIFNDQKSVTMFEIAKLISNHLK